MRISDWSSDVCSSDLPLLFVSACGQSDEAKDDMEVKQTYSLCPISEDSRQRLYDQVKSFADHQGARFIDRSAGAKQELSDIGSDVLNKTGGSPILQIGRAHV